MANSVLKKLDFTEKPFMRHCAYFMGFQLINVLFHLIILSVVIFFHFLLDHRLADIQDWIFFHGWEILILGKLLSLAVMSRFLGILSNERNPLKNIVMLSKGVIRAEILVSIAIMLLGLMIIGRPVLQDSYKWSLYPLVISFFGSIVFLGSDAALVIVLNRSMPLKRKAWNLEIIVFPIISFICHKLIFLYGLKWEGHIIFSLILVLFCLRLRGDFVWLHAISLIVLLIGPLYSIFGLDPLWGSRFSPFTFSRPLGGLEFGVFVMLILGYFRAKRLNLIPS